MVVNSSFGIKAVRAHRETQREGERTEIEQGVGWGGGGEDEPCAKSQASQERGMQCNVIGFAIPLLGCAAAIM